MSASWPTSLPFKVWYCAECPVEAIRFDRTARPEREEWRIALAENIRQNGLVNPLIILNHPRRKCPDFWLMVGTNRLWAIRYLGWEMVPAIVTGSCPFPAVEVLPADVPSYFRDGTPYLSCYGIALTGVKRPELREYPD